MKKKMSLATLALVSTATGAWSDAGHVHHDRAIGQPGHADFVDRQIEVSMVEMDFDPDEIQVSPGETIRFVISNDGDVIHEFNIGTPESWDEHHEEMAAMMQEGVMTLRELKHDKMREKGMMHDDPSSVLLEPGQTAELIWTFPDSAEMPGYACNVPGHLSAGMVGDFVAADVQHVTADLSAKIELAAPEVVTKGASIEGNTVMIHRVVAKEDGYVVIHAAADGQPVVPESLGHAAVRAGVNEHVKITISEPFAEGEEYIAMLHVESNRNDTFDFGPESTDVDTPVTEDGEAVASGFSGS